MSAGKRKYRQLPKDEKPRTGSAWDSIGGRWPKRMADRPGEIQLCYALIRSAVETLVCQKDGRKWVPGRAYLVASDYWQARQWIFDDECQPMMGETPSLTCDQCCKACGFDLGALRTLLRNAEL